MLKDKKNNGTLTQDSSWMFSLFLSCLEKSLVKCQSSLLDYKLLGFWNRTCGTHETKTTKSHLTEVKRMNSLLKEIGISGNTIASCSLQQSQKFSFMYTLFLLFPPIQCLILVSQCSVCVLTYKYHLIQMSKVRRQLLKLEPKCF